MPIVPEIGQFCTHRFFANRHHRLLRWTQFRYRVPCIMLNRFWVLFRQICYHFLSLGLALSLSILMPHTVRITGLAIRLEPRSSTAFYFDSYCLSPHIHDIQSFLRRNCTVLNYNNAQLQGPMSTVCGKYCCLFALYMDRGYTGKQFVGLFTPGLADQQGEQLFASEFGSLRGVPRGGLC